MNLSDERLRDKFRGCLLGLAVGDAVGRYWEGVPYHWIAEQHEDITSLLARVPDETRYTDDTQMAIGVAETLVDCGQIDQEVLVEQFVANYEPWRGYGQGARRVLQVMEQGGDWRAAAAGVFPGGSFGNGAAMRVAPVGAFFHDDLDRVWAEAELSARPTHVHPLGIEGAQVLATAVAWCTRSDHTLDANAMVADLSARCTSDEFRDKLALASRVVSFHGLHALGNGIAAHESAVTAIACCALFSPSYVDTIGHAILLGGDTDTIAAMAGACSGALLGIDAIPAGFLERLENNGKGRDYLYELSDELSAKLRD